MSNEDLLKPRYRVIADYPGNTEKVGFVYEQDMNGHFWDSTESDYESEGMLQGYPHLFKPLAWWEERKESEMPEYVKYSGGGSIRKVTLWDLESTSAWFMFLDNEVHPYCPGGSALTETHWLPATKEEYDTYIKSLKEKL